MGTDAVNEGWGESLPMSPPRTSDSERDLHRELEQLHSQALRMSQQYATVRVCSQYDADILSPGYFSPTAAETLALLSVLERVSAGEGAEVSGLHWDAYLPGRYQGFELRDLAWVRDVRPGDVSLGIGGGRGELRNLPLADCIVRGSRVRRVFDRGVVLEYEDPERSLERELLQVATAHGLGDLLQQWNAPL